MSHPSINGRARYKRKGALRRMRERMHEGQLPKKTVIFETLEPRLLLNANPLAIPAVGTALASDTSPALVQDADGTQLTVNLSGPGHWQVIQGDAGPRLSATGTDATSQLGLQTAGGDGRFQLTGVYLNAPLKSLTGQTTDLAGDLLAKGSIGALILGDVTGPSHVTLQGSSTTSQLTLRNVQDLTVEATASIATLSVNAWNQGGASPDEIEAPFIGTLSSQGDWNASLSLSGQGAPSYTLTSASIKGTLTNSLWYVIGRTGTISAGAIAPSWIGDFTGPVNQITTAGDFGGQLRRHRCNTSRLAAIWRTLGCLSEPIWAPMASSAVAGRMPTISASAYWRASA